MAISPVPALGVLSGDPHFGRANHPHINPFAGNRPGRMTPERFHYRFANTMSRVDSDAALYRYVVPENRNVSRRTLTTQARLRFKAPHAPLLFVAGDQDHLTPATMIRRNARASAEPVGVDVHRPLTSDL